MVNARLHLVESARFSPISVDLSPPGNSRFDLVPDHVSLYEIAINFIVCHSVRARANDTHASLQDVDELREFVEGILAQKGSDASDSRIVFLCLPYGIAIFANSHGAKFINENFLSI